MTAINRYATVVNLNDDVIIHGGEKAEVEADLKFLKKHIKYKVSELFFSDAVILVEGLTEYTLLPYYIERDNRLNKYYISIFNIDGAHAFVYKELLKQLKVPALIITDLDIERKDREKGECENDEKSIYLQMKSLRNRITTNETLKSFHNNKKIVNISDCFKDENICVVCQRKKISGYYATSFEEAFILTNYDNEILNSTLKKVKSGIYKRIVGQDDKVDYDNNITHSFEWQCKLGKSKSDFANELLYQFITEEGTTPIPELPDYIKKGMDELEKKLKGVR